MNDDASEVAESDEAGDAAADPAAGDDTPTEEAANAGGPDAAEDGHDGNGRTGETAEPSVADRVAEYDAELAEEVRQLEAEAAESTDEVDDLQARLKRVQADFQNYKKRAKRKEREIRSRATEEFVERVVEVRDNLVRALDQDAEADIRPGVEATLETFDRILSEEGVDAIDPEAGEAVDPMRHEVMMRVDSDHPDGTVVDVYRPGYEMGDKVVREAQVTVSTGGDGTDGDAEEGADAADAADEAADADANAAAADPERGG